MNLFTPINLSDRDAIEACILNAKQKIALQNRIQNLIVEMVQTSVIRLEQEHYLRQVAYMQGQLAELQSMLEASDAAEHTLANLE